MKKIALLGDFQGILNDYENVRPETLGRLFSTRQLTVVFDSFVNINSSLSNTYHDNNGKCIFITLSNDVDDRHQNCEILVARDEMESIDLIYSTSSEFYLFPGGPEILSRLSYFWVKNTMSNAPKQIYLVGEQWKIVAESFKANGVITDLELKFTKSIDPSELIDFFVRGS